MKKSRFTEEQIIGVIRQAEAGEPVKEWCRKTGFGYATIYKWRAKYGGMDVPAAKRLCELESETPSSRSCWPGPRWTSTLSRASSG